MALKGFDIEFIPEFSGADTDPPILEWLEDLELTCELCEITDVERVVQIRLKGEAMETYKKLSALQKTDFDEIKRALLKVYGTDSFSAFERFTTRRLSPGETIDEYLADLQKLAQRVGEMPPECWMKTAFITGLPSHVSRRLRSSAMMENYSLKELLEKARAMMVEKSERRGTCRCGAI